MKLNSKKFLNTDLSKQSGLHSCIWMFILYRRYHRLVFYLINIRWMDSHFLNPHTV